MPRYMFINLDRVPERARFMEGQARKVGIDAQIDRIAATDALTEAPSDRYRPHGWGPRWELSRSEIACFESHRRCWQRLRDEGLSHAVILEDDVILSTRLPEAVAALCAAGPPADVVKLDGVRQMVRYGSRIPVGASEFGLRAILQTVHSAGCYLVSAAGADKLLAASASFCDHLDDFVFNPRAAWSIAQIEPAVALQAVLAAGFHASGEVGQSERTRQAGINAAKARGPLPYRVLKEARRSARALRWRLYADRRLRAGGGRIGPVPLAADLGDYR